MDSQWEQNGSSGAKGHNLKASFLTVIDLMGFGESMDRMGNSLIMWGAWCFGFVLYSQPVLSRDRPIPEEIVSQYRQYFEDQASADERLRRHLKVLLGPADSSCRDELPENSSECISSALNLVETLSENELYDAVSLMLTEEGVYLDGDYVPLTELQSHSTKTLNENLHDRLQNIPWMGKRFNELFGTDSGFRGRLLLSIPADIPMFAVDKVVRTANYSQFGNVGFVGLNPWTNRLSQIEIQYYGATSDWDPKTAILGDDPKHWGPLRLATWDPNEDGLELLLALQNDGIEIEINHCDVSIIGSTGKLEIPCFSGACNGIESYDWQSFGEALSAIKGKHPNLEHRVQISSGPEVTWDIVFRAVDYAQNGPLLVIDADQNDWEEWKAERVDMFPGMTIEASP